jgi:hexosaminidase
MLMKRILTSLVFLAGLSAGSLQAAPGDEPCLVPWPKTLTMGQGRLDLGERCRIVADAPALAPLAGILADEIRAIAGLKPATAVGKPGAGDIGLSLDPALRGERYRLDVADRAVVAGGNYAAVVMGTVTLLESLVAADGKISLPRVAINDEPAAAYRGLMIDVARRYHSIAGLKRIVQLCRLYKVRYLQLHLTDDQGFMFPSKAYPLLATKNENGGKTYTIEQLEDLVAYADARGVTIIPEYEMPGHSAAANRAMHDLFIIAKTKPYEHHASINFCKDEVMRAVATIVGEMCEVFRSSPYFHIGGDEADLALADQNVDFKAAMKKHDLPNQHELYRRFICQMNEIVKHHGKQMIVWEGFGRQGRVPIPKDIVVMSYEIRFYMPGDLLQDGYPVINASWTPLYVVNANARPPEEIFAWRLTQFKPFGAKPADPGQIVPPSRNLLGAQMCAWEQPEASEMPSTRKRLPAMIERIWNPDAGRSYRDFERRLSACNRLLDLL